MEVMVRVLRRVRFDFQLYASERTHIKKTKTENVIEKHSTEVPQSNVR